MVGLAHGGGEKVNSLEKGMKKIELIYHAMYGRCRITKGPNRN